MRLKNFPYPIVFFLLCAENVLGQQGQPDPPIITSVFVTPQPANPGAISLFWIDNNNPKTDGVIIFRFDHDNISSSAYRPIDTVFSTDTYIDFAAKANEHFESYRIKSFYKINGNENNLNTSTASNTVTSIYLQIKELDPCKPEAVIIWNNYEGWDVQYYKVYRNNSDQNHNDKDTIFIDTKIITDTLYEYYVRAIGPWSYRSESNRIQLKLNSFQKPDSNLFYINQIKNNGNSIEFSAQVDTAADISKYTLRTSSNKDGTYTLIDENLDTLSTNLTFTHNYSGLPQYYKVAAIDNCNETAGETPRVKPLQLIVKQQDYDVTLEWDTSFVDAMNETYEVYLSIDDLSEEKLEPKEIYKLDELGSETSERYCFKVVATDINGYTSISQTECVTRNPVVEIPEAFSPNSGGKYQYFGPFVNSGDPERSYIQDVTVTDFSLYVYDRYGGKIYYTDDKYDFWDGKIKGVLVSEGGYLYYYTYTTSLGKSYKGSGAINVVYP